ncbi:DNA methyltransferase [hot springs metagenome]|uniref:site-specific DNA-methyltransferase (adenine-specific) n=1 Tax=hot springs metagenome TaxID=433727 RepID=A0A5J4L2W6_9ZZZZ
MLRAYLKQLFETASQGDAREESFYPCLTDLLRAYSESGDKKLFITSLPKKTEAGNPDFRIWDGRQNIVGYIEAKPPHQEALSRIEDTEQLKRYLETFPNLILTNFFEFRLYRNGELIDNVKIARPFVMHRLGTIPPLEREREFFSLLDKFLSFSLPKTYTARALAEELAKRTRFLKEIIYAEIKDIASPLHQFTPSPLHQFYDVFKRYLISDLTEEDFADLYAQTITYGLFAARTRSDNGFNRKLAYDRIPKTIGILRDVFKFISLGDLPHQMEWIIDDISEVLAVTDVARILDEYFHEHKGSDPIVHFYETFLSKYDPETRERRGVYYTPEPVVSYIVRSINELLKSHFGRTAGFASRGVTVLDPAAGTLTFIAESAKVAVEEFSKRYGTGGISKFIKEHILKNFYAFELMMAPYAIGHLKISFLLEELGYKLTDEDRFMLYLTNTLEMEELEQSRLPGMASLSEESHLAGEVKKEKPILVILGNPPYSGHSLNIGEWISREIKEYYQVDGKPLKEKNPKWLQDDYVKFIRFAQWKIDEAGEGILGFITNHSYLDNPTFRGMRQSLMKTFNQIYLLDLHGNSKKREICPDGSKDENVFDIQQGVAIGIFVKKGKGVNAEKVFHSEIWGLREKKYEWLNNHSLNNTRWKRLRPKSEFYLFIPRDEGLLKRYESYPKITDIFPVSSVGIVTARDNLTIKWTKEEMWKTVLNFSRLDIEIARKAYDLGKDVRDWKVELAQKDLKESGIDREKIIPILYRPFDIRYTYYTGRSRGFHCMPRPEVMRHMMRENIGLILAKRYSVGEYNYAFVGDSIMEGHVLSGQLGITYLFPLYLYEYTKKPNTSNPSSHSKSFKKKTPHSYYMDLQDDAQAWMLFEEEAEYLLKKPNIAEDFLKRLTEQYRKTPTPEEILYYIYAILYSNTYRKRYAEFLRIDFPRIPFIEDYKIFQKFAKYGERLVRLHLMKTEEINSHARFEGKGSNKVEKVAYKDKRLYINDSQFFDSIEPSLYQYQIGGYRVLEKWLKDRRDRILSLDEIRHYCQIVGIIKETIILQGEIDKKFEEDL